MEETITTPIEANIATLRQWGTTVLQEEAEGLHHVASLLTDTFAQSVLALAACKGRAVVTGIGKSAVIAQKMVATFNSTGQPAIFLHAADAIHGDLGMVQQDDLVIALSQSGNTPEIKVLIPLVARLGVQIIAITGSPDSYLAQQAHLVISSAVESEACPHNLAPTTSTTATLALGDALAVALLKYKGFRAEDFAMFHPGGALGKRLYLKVSDIYPANAFPTVLPDSPLQQVILQITSGRVGAVAVLSPDGALTGIVTDGDLRRMLSREAYPLQNTAADILSPTPTTVDADATASQALSIMQARNINQLIVLKDGAPAGFIHIHDLIREGIV